MAGILNGFDVRTALQVVSEDALGDAPEIHFFLWKIQCEGFLVYFIRKIVREILRIKFRENGAGRGGRWGSSTSSVEVLPPTIANTREVCVSNS